MADEYVNIIRKSTRDLLSYNRKLQKDVVSDVHRPISDPSIKEEDILKIANKLKTKSKITTRELLMVKNGIMDKPNYIEVIFNVHGALRGVTRELTGKNAENKIAAAGCCCNLALGDERACTVVAKAMGSYLTAELDSLNHELAIISAWTIGNLAGSGRKTCIILTDQGAIAKLIDLFISDDLRNAALYALEHYAYQMKDDLRSEHLAKILSSVSQVGVDAKTSRLLFILSCHNEFVNYLSEDLLLITLRELSVSVDKKSDFLYIIRTLANSEHCDIILNYFHRNNLHVIVKIFLADNIIVIRESMLWLLGNLYKHDADHIFFQSLLC